MSPTPRDEHYPLSFAQQRLWFLDQLEPGNIAYNVPFALRLGGTLDLAALKHSLHEMARRHDVLRTTFDVVGGQPVQVIAERANVPLTFVDLTGVPEAVREAEARQRTDQEARRPFDLARGPLLRASVMRLSEREHVLLFTTHHIVSDAWSTGIFSREVALLYGAFTAGEASPLSPLPMQYADYAAWQRSWLKGEALDRHLAYWKEQLAGVLPLELATDRPRPPVQRYRGARATMQVPAELLQTLRGLSRREGATLYMVLLAAYQTLLARYSGQEDIAVGSPIAGRTRAELEDVIGFFVNTLVLRTNLGGDPTFREMVGRVREVALGAYAHQDLPFEKLVEVLAPERDLARSPLFQTMFIVQNAPATGWHLAKLQVEPLRVNNGTAKFDLTLSVVEEGGGLLVQLEYSTDLFEAATAERMLGHWRTLLEGVASDPDRRLSELPLLTRPEREQLEAWGQKRADYAADVCLHELFETQVERTPEAVAVVHEGERLTYAELNARANQLAHYLRAQGVGPEHPVGLCVERSLDTVIAILAVLKAGGAYLPLDPTYPAERVAFLLADAGVHLLLTQRPLLERLPKTGAHFVCLDADWQQIAPHGQENIVSGAGPDSLAYVIYTSGSTGKPKGVLVTHRNVTRLFAATQAWFAFGPQDVWTLFHSYAFDFSVWELWGALLYGGRLVVVPYLVTRSPEEMLRLLARERVTVLNQTPSAFDQLTGAEAKLGGAAPKLALRVVIFGGEALEVGRLRPWVERHGAAGPRLVNMYGITETTVHVTYRELAVEDVLEGRGSVIGVPLPDLRVHVLDAHQRVVPVGVPGELWVGGAGVARGYLNRPELSARRFVADPAGPEPEALLYRTGDMGRWLVSGELEYLGRKDGQVKLRGYRIEPGEIEAALRELPGVREAVAVAREDVPGDKRLVGYVVAESSVSVDELRRALMAKLPDYMVPSVLVSLERIPLTPNGKVEHGALPAPQAGQPAFGDVYVAPRTPVEEVVAGIWCEVLGLERVGIHQNFFELGGHSIRATQVTARVLRALGVDLPLRSLFEQPTVAALATVVAQHDTEAAERDRVAVLLGELANLSDEKLLELLSAEAADEEDADA